MSVAALRRVTSTTRNPTSAYGVAVLGLTRSLDAGSTLLGLALVPGLEEANPLARAVFAAIGPAPGIAVLSLVAILSITLVTETGVLLLESGEDAMDGTVVRYLGYGIPSVLSVVAAVHNLRLVVVAGVA